MRAKARNIDSYKRIAKKYFELCDEQNAKAAPKIAKPYTLAGFLHAAELNREQFFSLARSREGRRFVNSTLMKIEAFIQENALNGRISASAAANALKNSFYPEEKEQAEKPSGIVVSLSDKAKKLGEYVILTLVKM